MDNIAAHEEPKREKAGFREAGRMNGQRGLRSLEFIRSQRAESPSSYQCLEVTGKNLEEKDKRKSDRGKVMKALQSPQGTKTTGEGGKMSLRTDMWVLCGGQPVRPLALSSHLILAWSAAAPHPRTQGRGQTAGHLFRMVCFAPCYRAPKLPTHPSLSPIIQKGKLRPKE